MLNKRIIYPLLKTTGTITLFSIFLLYGFLAWLLAFTVALCYVLGVGLDLD